MQTGRALRVVPFPRSLRRQKQCGRGLSEAREVRHVAAHAESAPHGPHVNATTRLPAGQKCEQRPAPPRRVLSAAKARIDGEMEGEASLAPTNYVTGSPYSAGT